MNIHVKRFSELTTQELYALLQARAQVFVVEQNIPYQDLDDDDQAAVHVWIEDGGRLVACTRVCAPHTHMENVCIGRVLTTVRGRGYGLVAVKKSLEVAVEYFAAEVVDIEAQEYAKAFYEKAGFRQTSGTFILDTLPHIGMRWTKGEA